MDAAGDEHQRRDTAAELERDHPRWLVLYGLYSCQFVAFPRFAAPRGTVLSATQPGELVRLMEKTEARFIPPAS